MNNIQIPYVFRLAATLLCVTLLVYWMHVLQSTLVLLLFSILFSMLLFPICLSLEKWGISRLWAISLTMLLATTVVLGLITVTTMQISGFYENVPHFTHKLHEILDKLQTTAEETFNIDRARQVKEINIQTKKLLDESGTYLSSFLSTTSSMLGALSLIPIFVFFFLYYRDFFRIFIYKVFSKVEKNHLNNVIAKIYEVIQGYMVGTATVIGIVATLNTIGLLCLGIDYAIFFGVLAAVSLLIPYIGILLGSLLPMIMALITKDSYWYAVGVAGIFLSVQFLEGNFITPYIVGSKVSINPLAAMIALILGGQLWGLPGLVLALPVTAILKVIFDSINGLKPYGYILGQAEHRNPRKFRNIKEKVQIVEKKLEEALN
ncbi:Predicted PurR-regulated permease PerM [Pseudarcicella hirudinis]|uniref:Predicted PurR-regulated permease PerM n=1 Tax=Pseudarcicella hirudinis TaxID=1079859 RepID=A0A1I5XDS9_9BACT|nr:AI-2E family transporter [Pseudarcicella hirudinis]SFQ30135.1 Predicted PurR-regulated permease PerM [Pseudarcicella hirudinis]